jgi:hypothetical protein
VQGASPELMKQVSREAAVCAILAFPIMVIASAALDITLVIVSVYPPLTYFLSLERIMPAYWAYRTLIEIVLEAIPQARRFPRPFVSRPFVFWPRCLLAAGMRGSCFATCQGALGMRACAFTF